MYIKCVCGRPYVASRVLDRLSGFKTLKLKDRTIPCVPSRVFVVVMYDTYVSL
jgi:hypothetical protein